MSTSLMLKMSRCQSETPTKNLPVCPLFAPAVHGLCFFWRKNPAVCFFPPASSTAETGSGEQQITSGDWKVKAEWGWVFCCILAVGCLGVEWSYESGGGPAAPPPARLRADGRRQPQTGAVPTPHLAHRAPFADLAAWRHERPSVAICVTQPRRCHLNHRGR